jgi:4-hydroxy-4-methyl-2-oxoglutarate aldolase
MKNTTRVIMLMSVAWAALASPSFAQLGLFTPEQRIQFSPDWKGERFADGRPKVPDETLARLKDVTAEEAWGVLRKENFRNQFEGNWTVVNSGPRLVGRVVTAVFMPYRPDFDNVVRANGKAEGRIGAENSWVIDILQPGDVLVVDLFGKVQDGTMIGDNLGTAIWTKSHNGLIVNGAVRDVSGIREIEGFQVFTKGVDPSALQNVMLTGVNTPIRIGQATVLPGDIAVSDPEGITFIPPHLAAKVADETEMTHLVDEWGHAQLRAGKYTPGQIDGKWTTAMVDEFNAWLTTKGSKLRMPRP